MKILVFAFAIACGTFAHAQTPQQIEREILGHLKNISKTGSYSGTFNETKLYAENRLLRSKLLKHGKRLAVLKYPFSKLKGEMFVATSKDGKLRIYSWDMQTGGTMHDYAAVFQYVGKNKKVNAISEADEDESAGSFYTEIFQVASKKGPIYLTTSTFVGSSSLNGQSIDAMRINGDQLDRTANVIRTGSGMKSSVSFSYDFFTVVDRRERPIKLFFFDEAKKEFRFPVIIEDEKTPQGRVTKRFITYRFNGDYFTRVR